MPDTVRMSRPGTSELAGSRALPVGSHGDVGESLKAAASAVTTTRPVARAVAAMMRWCAPQRAASPAHGGEQLGVNGGEWRL